MRFIAVLLVTLALIAGISLAFSLDLSSIVKYMDIILVASLISIIVFILKGIRFYMILKYSEINLSFYEALSLRFGSEFFSLIGVSYVGDELYRIYHLERMNIDRGLAISISYSEVFMEVLTSFIIILFGSIFSLLNGFFNIYLYTGLVISLIIIIGNILFILGFSSIYKLVSNIASRIGFKSFSTKYVTEDIDSFKNHFHSVILRPKIFLVIFTISLFIGIFSGLVLHVISTNFVSNYSLAISLLIVYIANTISSIPITVGGLGVTEGVIISSFYSMDPSLSAYIAILYRISSYLIPLVISGILVNIGIFRSDSSSVLRRG